MAATWDVPEHLKTFEMISDEARAKYNKSFDEAQKTGRYEGLTFWTPISIFSVIQDGEEVRKPMVKILI
jgi:beta-glucosidase